MKYKMKLGLDLIMYKNFFLDEEINKNYELELLERETIDIEKAIEDLGFTVISEKRHDSNITLIEAPIISITKDTLKVGQFVKDRNNGIYVIGNHNIYAKENPYFNECLTLIDLNGMGDYPIDINYDDNLRDKEYPELDIMEVANDFNFKDIVWVRPTD